jgi:hypothetical protein
MSRCAKTKVQDMQTMRRRAEDGGDRAVLHVREHRSCSICNAADGTFVRSTIIGIASESWYGRVIRGTQVAAFLTIQRCVIQPVNCKTGQRHDRIFPCDLVCKPKGPTCKYVIRARMRKLLTMNAR